MVDSEFDRRLNACYEEATVWETGGNDSGNTEGNRFTWVPGANNFTRVTHRKTLVQVATREKVFSHEGGGL